MPLFAAEKDSSVDSSKMGPEETAASKPVVPPIPNKDASEKSDAVASAKSGSVVAASTPVIETKEEEPQRLSVFDLEDKKDDDAAKSKAAPSPAPKAPAPAPAPKPAPVVDTPAPAPKPAPLADTKEKAPQSNFFDAFKKVERYLPSMSRIVLAFNSLSLSFVCLYRTFSAALQWIPLHPPPRLPRPRPSRRLLL